MGAVCSSKVDPPNPNQVDLSHFEMLRLVGKGGFGKVNAVRSLSSGSLFALKRLWKRSILRSQAQARTHLALIFNERRLLVMNRKINKYMHNFDHSAEEEEEEDDDDEEEEEKNEVEKEENNSNNENSGEVKKSGAPNNESGVSKRNSITLINNKKNNNNNNNYNKKEKVTFLMTLEYAFQSSDELFLVMPFLTGGDLRYHLNIKGSFSERACRFYAAELLIALSSLHRRKIVYRDLKPDNIMLDGDGHICISDFGLACQLKEENGFRTTGRAGTSGYQAPEVIRGRRYGCEVDVWSYGVLLYELLHGHKMWLACIDDSSASNREVDCDAMVRSMSCAAGDDDEGVDDDDDSDDDNDGTYALHRVRDHSRIRVRIKDDFIDTCEDRDCSEVIRIADAATEEAMSSSSSSTSTSSSSSSSSSSPLFIEPSLTRHTQSLLRALLNPVLSQRLVHWPSIRRHPFFTDPQRPNRQNAIQNQSQDQDKETHATTNNQNENQFPNHSASLPNTLIVPQTSSPSPRPHRSSISLSSASTSTSPSSSSSSSLTVIDFALLSRSPSSYKPPLRPSRSQVNCTSDAEYEELLMSDRDRDRQQQRQRRQRREGRGGGGGGGGKRGRGEEEEEAVNDDEEEEEGACCGGGGGGRKGAGVLTEEQQQCFAGWEWNVSLTAPETGVTMKTKRARSRRQTTNKNNIYNHAQLGLAAVPEHEKHQKEEEAEEEMVTVHHDASQTNHSNGAINTTTTNTTTVIATQASSSSSTTTTTPTTELSTAPITATATLTTTTSSSSSSSSSSSPSSSSTLSLSSSASSTLASETQSSAPPPASEIEVHRTQAHAPSSTTTTMTTTATAGTNTTKRRGTKSVKTSTIGASTHVPASSLKSLSSSSPKEAKKKRKGAGHISHVILLPRGSIAGPSVEVYREEKDENHNNNNENNNEKKNAKGEGENETDDDDEEDEDEDEEDENHDDDDDEHNSDGKAIYASSTLVSSSLSPLPSTTLSSPASSSLASISPSSSSSSSSSATTITTAAAASIK